MCRLALLFSVFVSIAAGLLVPTAGASAAAQSTPANVMAEVTFESAKKYDDPFNDVTLDVVFVDPAGKEYRVPAFWAGGTSWHVRYASGTPGVHRYETHCSDPGRFRTERAKGDD